MNEKNREKISGKEAVRSLLEGRMPGAIGLLKEYALMILTTEVDGELAFVFEKRAKSIKQAGDLCFPGGRMEAGEDVPSCALRETEEELGIPQGFVEVLGRFDSHYELHGTAIHSVIGFVSCDLVENAVTNPSEVEELVVVKASEFLEREPILYEYDIIQVVDDFPYGEVGISPDYKWRKGRQQIPIYLFDDKIVWGLTGNYVRCLLAALFGEKQTSHQKD